MENQNLPGLTILAIPLEAGKHYTIYACSDSAMTTRREIRMIGVLPTPQFRPSYVGALKGKWRLGTFREPRKQTAYYLDVDVTGTLVIPGTLHGVPTDHERWSSFSISATINLAATPERIRELVGLNINPNFAAHDTLVAYPRPLNSNVGDNGSLVYPDVPTSHAVIQRMRDPISAPAGG